MSGPVLNPADGPRRIVRLDRDRGLVEAARRDPTRFEALYRKYLAQVYSYAFYELRDHHAAEDATERVFMQALAGLGRFEERVDEFLGSSAIVSEAGTGVADISTFRVWLLRIAHNVVSNERRRARRRPVSSLDDATALRAPDDVDETAAMHEAGAAAWQAVARLPEDRRRAVILRFVDEMSTAEIAAALGRSEGAVRVLLHRALRAVARDLRERIR